MCPKWLFIYIGWNQFYKKKKKKKKKCTAKPKHTIYKMNNNDIKLRVAYIFGLYKILIFLSLVDFFLQFLSLSHSFLQKKIKIQ